MLQALSGAGCAHLRGHAFDSDRGTRGRKENRPPRTPQPVCFKNKPTGQTGCTTWPSRGGMAEGWGQEGGDPLGLVVVRASGRLGRLQLYEQQRPQQHPHQHQQPQQQQLLQHQHLLQQHQHLKLGQGEHLFVLVVMVSCYCKVCYEKTRLAKLAAAWDHVCDEHCCTHSRSSPRTRSYCFPFHRHRGAFQSCTIHVGSNAELQTSATQWVKGTGYPWYTPFSKCRCIWSEDSPRPITGFLGAHVSAREQARSISTPLTYHGFTHHPSLESTCSRRQGLASLYSTPSFPCSCSLPPRKPKNLYLFRACCAPTTLSTRKAADLVHVVSEQTAAEIDVHLKGVPLRLREIIAFVQLLRSKIGQRS